MTTSSSNTPPKTYLRPALLVTLFAFLPVGIFAVKQALEAKEFVKRGELAKAHTAAKASKRLSIIGASIALAIYSFGFLGWVYLTFSANTASDATQTEILGELFH